MSIEANIKASFRDVKLEMISIKSQILQLAEDQKELRDMVLEVHGNHIHDKIKKLKKKSSGKKKVKKAKVVKAKKTGSKKRK